MINDIGCPLYASARDKSLWKSAEGHTGLIFDKFGDAWRLNADDSSPVPEFDKGHGPGKRNANQWLNSFTKKAQGSTDQLDKFARRQRKLVTALGGVCIQLTNDSRFVTGMGRQHPMENGFTWHPTLATPYLPGSSLKGMLRSWSLEEALFTHSNESQCETEIQKHFGTMNHIGEYICFDLIPLQPVQLVVEILTPHYGPYYQGESSPGDWLDPTPIAYLAVEADQGWQVAMAPRQGNEKQFNKTKIEKQLLNGLQELGVGGKTNIGMGRFSLSEKLKKKVDDEDKEEITKKQQVQARQQEEEIFNASIANASSQLQELLTLKHEQQWQPVTDNKNAFEQLIAFADKHKTLPSDCIDEVRRFMESIPKCKSVWSNPDATQGKKNKPKYATKVREVVKKYREFHSGQNS